MANPNDQTEMAQIYLITPPELDLSAFNSELAELLDGFDIACVRLRLSSDDASIIGRTADLLREICHKRDVPIVIDSHYKLVETHGLDGVHLPDGPRQVRYVREQLHNDAIIGAFCAASSHSGMTAGEAGADYVSFGPVSETALGGQSPAPLDLFDWWSQTVEVPLVAEGNISLDAARTLAPHTDFFALGSELWSHVDGPKAALTAYFEAIVLP